MGVTMAEIDDRLGRIETLLAKIADKILGADVQNKQAVDAMLKLWQNREAETRGNRNGSHPMTAAEAEELYRNAEADAQETEIRH